jgi:predicted dehydrogenase
VKDKELAEPLSIDAPDFSVACIRFASGVVARMTNSIVAPEDHSIRIFGDEGMLSVDDCWKPDEPVHLKKRLRIAGRSVMAPVALRAKPVRDPYLPRPKKKLKKVDYCLGPLELVNAIRDRRPSRLSARFCLHITELTLATHESIDQGRHVPIKSRFDPIAPMPWAE